MICIIQDRQTLGRSVAESQQHNRVRVRLESMIVLVDVSVTWQPSLPQPQALFKDIGEVEIVFCGLPKRRVGATARVVVQCEKLTYAINAIRDRLVIASDHFFINLAVWKMAHQLLDSVLDKEDAGGLERFDKAAGQTDCSTVSHPGPPIPPYAHPDV